MFNSIRKRLSQILYPSSTNSMSLPEQFRVYGNRREMTPDWTQVMMSDEDLYTGYPYAAIRKRANAVARFASEYLTTESKKKEFEHPYISLIRNSKYFSRRDFWYKISTYLDLEGVFYLMAVRNFDGEKFGEIKYFKLLSPYNVRRVLNKEALFKNGELSIQGYIESRYGYTRTIAPEQIIDIREMNPFSEEKPLAMTDAAKEAQFTIKTAGDFTRHSLKHNINAPGILATDIIMEDEEFKNFVSRVKKHTKGEPLFGNGKGSLSWNDMNVNIKDAALKEVNEMNRDILFTVAGMSKTMMGIEESGTTRETSKVQQNLFTEYEVMPRVQLILDALNLDYKNKYPKEFASNDAIITFENPLKTDHESDQAAAIAMTTQKDAYTDLVDRGYDPKLAAKYVEGDIDIDELGEPDRKKAVKPLPPTAQNLKPDHEHDDEKKNNQIADTIDTLIGQQEGSLKNAVMNIERNLVAECISNINKSNNAYESSKDVISKREKDRFINDLEIILASFYGIVMSLQGGKVMRNRTNKFALPGQFLLDVIVKKYIKGTASAVAESHVTTVIDDILAAAREMAKEGKGIDEVTRNIKKMYSETVTQTRAKTIARTETNRAFTRAQYEADREFIEQNKLKKRAFKQWKTRSDHPCEFCTALASEGRIPFDEPFRALGETVDAGDKSLDVGFESIQSGNAHPNCSCIYELIILDEK